MAVNMQVKDIMTVKPELTNPECTLKEAAEEMRNIDTGFIPIGENDRLIGTVTDRDIIIRGIAEGRDPNSTTIREVMSQDIEYCYEDDSIENALQMMEDKKIRRLVVLNRDKRLTGVISLGDIAATSQECEQLAGHALHKIAEAA